MNFASVSCFKTCEIVLLAGCCTYEAQNLRVQLFTLLTQQKQLLGYVVHQRPKNAWFRDQL